MCNFSTIFVLVIFGNLPSRLSSEPTPAPQLDLPPLPRNAVSTRPNIQPNSYAGQPDDEIASLGRDYNRDRSERFGPPYDGDDIFYKDPNSNRDGFNNNGAEKFYPHTVRDQNGRDRYNNNVGRFTNNNSPNLNLNSNYPNNNDPNDPRNNQNSNYDDGTNQLEQERRFAIANENLRNFLADIDDKSSKECSLNVAAQWNFETNVNEATQIDALTAQQRYSDFQRTIWNQIKNIDQNVVYDEALYRQLKLMSIIGPSALPPDQLDRYNRLINDMLAIYNGATICAYEQPFHCGLRLQPDLKDIMAKSRDWDELTHVWTEWRRKSGRNMREIFEQMVDLTNEAAMYNNFSNAADYWSFPYETSSLRDEMEQVWDEIRPLYELIHAYSRRKLREFYGPDKINKNAPLPDHILGNMYGQSWANILDVIIPYPGKSFIEVTPAMHAQGYTPLIMFQLAEEFFLSLNMTALPPTFWINSVLEEPVDRIALCQPSAWDFCNGRDYRIKMCTTVTHKDLITVHHEMAHIQYFINYRQQPKVFRDGANPGFHEAIGDAIGLSVATPKHLQTLGLVQKSVDDTAHDINFLFALAVDKIVFLPFALALEAWRYDVFSKRVSKEQYNCHWWLLREQYGGIKPPVLRSELDFDPGSKYHVPANIPYSRYFVGIIVQFQLHRALCSASRQFDPTDPQKPLHKCDIYRHPEAGNLLKELMFKGASKPWQEVLQEVIGEARLDGSAIREYFRPLEEWLRQENLRNQEFVGWMYDGDYCKHSIETANLQVYGGFYNFGSLIEFNLVLFYLILIITFLFNFH